jgi:hypothetical protein
LFSLDLVLYPFLYFVYVVGGLTLLFAPFERARRRSRWARGLLFTAAGLLVVKGAVELMLHYSLWTPSAALQRGLPHNLDFIAGAALGIFLALGFSGELVGRKDPDIGKPI